MNKEERYKRVERTLLIGFFTTLLLGGVIGANLVKATMKPTVIYETKVETVEVPATTEVVIETEEILAESETEADIDETPYLDIPLEHDLQKYIYELSSAEEVEFALVIAMIDIESDFDADCISKTNDYGLMQINKSNHKWLKDAYDITDFLDPVQNVKCGIVMISDYVDKFSTYHQALMAYNMGETRARNLINKGTVSSKYSRKVMAKYYEYQSMIAEVNSDEQQETR